MLEIYAVLYGIFITFILGGAIAINLNRSRKGFELSEYLMLGMIVLYIPILIGMLL